MNFGRREFLKKVGQATITAGFAGFGLPRCVNLGTGGKSSRLNPSLENYTRLTKEWDPIFGPSIQPFSRYGGSGDFQGHLKGGAAPGIDYDVLKGTPLVPPMTSYLRQITRDDNGALYLFLVDIFNPAYAIALAHLEEILVDDRFLIGGEVMRYLGEGVKVLGRGDMVALSGNSGFGPRETGYVQPPHLHFSFHYWNRGKRTLEPLDPEKYGIDGGKPVFWDGRTTLDLEAGNRLHRLELTLKDLEEDLEQWPRTPELQGLGETLMEHYRLLGDAKEEEILDSKHFQDMRALLKSVTLEEKKYLPGTAPYTMMLKILGYSTDERQKMILTLPFMSPGLEKLYQTPVYERAATLNLIPHKK